jgi:hypothetical protein
MSAARRVGAAVAFPSRAADFDVFLRTPSARTRPAHALRPLVDAACDIARDESMETRER